jgi:hypothetical protein
VLLHHTENLSKPEARAALALGREERLENPFLNLNTHAETRVVHLDHDVLANPTRAKTNRAPSWKRVDRVEDQVGQRLTDAAWPPLDCGIASD